MGFNSFGNIFCYTSWGESHGKSIGGVIDGVPSNIPLTDNDIQFYLDQRKPGKSSYVSTRDENDQVEILSGVFQEKTTGTPISFMIYNKDQKSEDYDDIKDKFRPGHADFTYFKKYGNIDYRGGGRSSARETAIRVAAGAIARKIVPEIDIKGALVQIGEHKIKVFDWSEVNKNRFRCPDSSMVMVWENYLNEVKAHGESVGAIVEVRVDNVPIGLGEPVYGKLDTALTAAIMSINAVQGVEFGRGFESVLCRGGEYVDEMYCDCDRVKFLTNNNGGILGGISTGQPIKLRFVVKPTSSIAARPLKTINRCGKNTEISIKGRHDHCVGIRAIPVAEAMIACVIADYYLINKSLNG